jgi:Flp pilus assembly protein TadB
MHSNRNDMGRCLTKVDLRRKRSAWPGRFVPSKRMLFVAVAVTLAVAWIASLLLPLFRA